jgi:adenylate cyclase
MDFANDAHKACYDRVADLMKELFGEFARPSATGPTFGITSGSAYVQVGVYPRGTGDVYVHVWAWVVMGPERTPELMAHLLNLNTKMRYCAFGMDEVGDILLSHTIKGSSCDKEALRTSINAVLFTADEEDDKIVARWGGRRASDPAPPAGA